MKYPECSLYNGPFYNSLCMFVKCFVVYMYTVNPLLSAPPPPPRVKPPPPPPSVLNPPPPPH